MRKRNLPVRAIALALLLGLPADAGARLAIDALAASAPHGQVESQHTQGCAWNHDHRICLLAHQAAAPSGPAPAASPAAAHPFEIDLWPETLPPRQTVAGLGPRAPPLLID